MDSSGLLLILSINIIILVLTCGIIVGFIYVNKRRRPVFTKLANSLELLGFQKHGEKTYLPVGNGSMLDFGAFSAFPGYYYGIVNGKQYEVRFSAVGDQKFKHIPHLEIALLGYFNARLSVSTLPWDKIHPHLSWSMPKELILPGCDNLVFRTADKNSGQFLLNEPVSRDPILALLENQKTASVLIAPKDIRFSIQLDNPDNISITAIQDWLRNLAEIAKIAAALPPLAPEALYDLKTLADKNRASKKKLLILMLLPLLLIPLIIIFLLLTQ